MYKFSDNISLDDLEEEIFMVRLIAGKEGTGKTKKIIEIANGHLVDKKGNIVFIDDDKRHMYELNHEMRFLSMDEFLIKTPEEFYGFLSGIISNDYDIETIYIDGIFKFVDLKMADVTDYFNKLKRLTDKYELEIVMTMSCDVTELGADVKAMML